MSNKQLLIKLCLFVGTLLVFNYSLGSVFTPLDANLFEAIRKNNIVKVGESLQKGANINAQNFLGNSTLHHAIKYSRTNLIKQLIDYGADPTIENVDKKSALDFILGARKPRDF